MGKIAKHVSSKDIQLESNGWSSPDGKTFIPRSFTIQQTLEPGFYSTNYSSNYGFIFVKQEFNSQKLLRLDGSISDLIISDIKKFWERKHIFDKYKFPYKRGILMHGAPGTGKSCTISLLTQDVINLGGYVMKINQCSTYIACMQAFRQIHPDAPIIGLMEDIDEIVNNESLPVILDMLDGVSMPIVNVVYLATTNNVSRLPESIKNRPSRFDRRFKFDYPSANNRKTYLESLFGTTLINDDWVNSTEGLSFAHLKELFTSVVILDNDFTASLNEIKQMMLSPEKDNYELDPISEEEDICP